MMLEVDMAEEVSPVNRMKYAINQIFMKNFGMRSYICTTICTI